MDQGAHLKNPPFVRPGTQGIAAVVVSKALNVPSPDPTHPLAGDAPRRKSHRYIQNPPLRGR